MQIKIIPFYFKTDRWKQIWMVSYLHTTRILSGRSTGRKQESRRINWKEMMMHDTLENFISNEFLFMSIFIIALIKSSRNRPRNLHNFFIFFGFVNITGFFIDILKHWTNILKQTLYRPRISQLLFNLRPSNRNIL